MVDFSHKYEVTYPRVQVAKNIVRMFYEHPNKFIDVYLREERRKSGCRTYQDHKGKVRLVSTGKLER